MIMKNKKQNEAEISPKFLLVTALAVLIVMVAVYFIGAQFREDDGGNDTEDRVYTDSEDVNDTKDQNGFPNDTDRDNEKNESADIGVDSEDILDSNLNETDTENEPTETETESETETETDPPETETDPPETETDPPPKETKPPETDPPETDPPETKPPETKPPETDPPETDPPKTEPPETDPPAPTDPPTTNTPPESLPSEAVMLFVNGVQCSFDAIYKGDTAYAPLGKLSAQIDSGTALNCNDNGSVCTVKASGIDISAEVGDIYVEANGRYLPCKKIYAEGGLVMAPISVVAKIFGATYTDLGDSIYVSAKTQYIQTGDDFYDADQLYWLSRIISSEAKNEPFDGKLAVGAVVMNRIRSSEFPNTIYEVLFEKNQFSTVNSDAFYRTPSSGSVIAAKLCLEGYLYDKRVLFFDSTYDSWAQRNRDFLFKLGDHYFYN